VIGGGGHAKVVIDVLLLAGWAVEGYTDPAPAAGDRIAGTPWLGGDAVLEQLRAGGLQWAMVALGDNTARLEMARRAVGLGFTLASAVHPAAQVSTHAVVGQGVAIMPGVVVNAGSVIGDNAVINTCSSVDHDCAIGAGVHIAPGAHLAGYVIVEEEVLIGSGAVVGRGKPIRVGRGAVVGAGSVVINDVAPGTTVAGNPARDLRAARPRATRNRRIPR